MAVRAAAAIGFLLAVSGCARSGLETTAAAAEKLSLTATAYVAIPEDGRFGTMVYTGSGREVATLVARAVAARLRHVEVAEGEQSPAATLAEARANGFTLLIRPRILRWEDHSGAWSGGPDRARILLETIDVATGDAAHLAVVDAQGADAGIMIEAPGDALEAPLAAYAHRLLPATQAARR